MYFCIKMICCKMLMILKAILKCCLWEKYINFMKLSLVMSKKFSNFYKNWQMQNCWILGCYLESKQKKCFNSVLYLLCLRVLIQFTNTLQVKELSSNTVHSGLVFKNISYLGSSSSLLGVSNPKLHYCK